LRNESIQVGIGRSFDIEVSSADIINSLIIEHDGDISVLEERVGGENGVVWLNNCGGNLWGWVHSETELGFLTIIDGESLKEKGSKSRSSSTTDGLENEETLETSALISKLSDSVEAEIDDFLTNGVVTSGEVVGGIFLTRDELLWMEELSVGSGSDLIDNGWLEIEEDSSWDVLTGTSLGEEGVESIVTTTDGFIGRHLTIWLDTVLEAEELPAGITDLDTGLADVDRNDFSHCVCGVLLKKRK
jgi:hypothetical protein